MLCHQCGSRVSPDATKCPNCQATLKRTTRSLELPSGGLERYTQKLRAITPADKRMFEQGKMLGGRYELGEMLGRGAFGQVFMAVDTDIDVHVAIKVFTPDFFEKDPSLKRFEPALKQARKLTQKNIVRINEHGEHDGHLWVAMQHLEGLSLRKLIKLRESKDEHFEAEEIDKISGQLLAALKHINKHHPHVNLKPENVIFLPDMLKVTDHYLYRALHPDALLANHIPNAYLAPETKKLSSSSPTERADIFSLGAIIAELAFGIPTLDALRELPEQKGFRAALLQECTRALSPNPDSRHGSLDAFKKALEAALTDSPAGLASPSVPALAPPPAPVGEAPSEVTEEEQPPAAPPAPPVAQDALPTEESKDAEPLGLGDALGLSESSVSEDDIQDDQTPLSEDEIATIEAERALSKPELGDLLPTNEVDRAQIPSPRKPALAEKASTSSLIDANKVKSAAASQQEEKGFPVGIVLFIAVAVLVIAGLIINANSKKEVVRIEDPVATSSDTATPSEQPTPPVTPPPVVVAQADAGKDLGTQASPEVIAALTQARDMGVKAVTVASLEATKTTPGEQENPVVPEDNGSSNPTDASTNTGAATVKNASASTTSTKKPEAEKKDDDAPKTNCPKGMVLLKSKKYPYSCVDRYEYPGKGKPKTRVTWFQAKKLCESSGKRLCARSEWSRACGGKYPWKGKTWDPNKCNTTDEDDFERSLASVGSFKGCRSSSGAYDMVGNAFEWTSEKRIVGGSHNSGEGLASCSYSSAKSPSSSSADIGFRCCADPN